MAKTKTLDSPRAPYQVLGHLHVDGIDYAPNRDKVVTVDLTEDEAAPLLASGVIGRLPDESVAA